MIFSFVHLNMNHKFQIKLINDIDNNEVIIIPIKILIDKRLESVKDWKKLEKDSSVKIKSKKNSIRVKNNNNKKDRKDKENDIK